MNKRRFQGIIKSKKPVVVDFYTDWCMPCKQVLPVLKDLKEELKESVKIVKVNVDKNPFIATHYDIRSLPTLMIFKEGDAVWKGLGVKSKKELQDVLAGHL